MMEDRMQTPPRPFRPGLPLDPILQLWAGAVTPTRVVTITVGGSVRAADENPMRVALYILPATVAAGWSFQPFGVVPSNTGLPTFDGLPTCIHCRDYPGITQAPWYIVGTLGDTFAVWEYQLLSQWG